MSTPSTATTALLPHPHLSRHPPYAPPRLPPPSLNPPSSDGRRTTAAHGKQKALPPAMATGAVEANGASRASQKKPDWGEFYKNGLPKEVIVIDDDDDDDEEPVRGRAKAVPASGPNRQPDKRRKTGAAAAYDAVYSQQSSSQTQSTDRTASALTTTAPTSYASQTSTRTHLSQADRSGVAGQKRKRAAQPGASEAAQNKRRNVEAAAAVAAESLLGAYVPPPKPPIKAKDVVVKVVPDKSARGHRIDDEDGHYLVAADADLTDRYKIAKMLGQGTFGKVVEAFDRQKHTKCAIKIIRSVPKYRDASRIELRVLTTLASNDKHNRNRCIHLRDCFDFRNHICIVTDLYSQSVFDFLKANSFVPFPSSHIQTFAKQLLASVAFLHDLHLIHTDLKPENILLVNSNYQMFTYNRNTPSSTATGSRLARHRRVLLDPEIRLIDFGSATFHDEYHSSVVSTRHYRAPEIILNLGWSYPCDIWSIGCILVEFYTGDALFQTHDNLEHLAMMETVCGYKLDKELVKQVNKQDRSARNSASGYFKGFQLHYPNKDTPKASKKYVRGMKRLEDTVQGTGAFNRQFLDLLTKIFVYDPKKRITAKQALQHPWFREQLLDDGTEAHRIKLERERKLRQRQADARY